MAVRATQLRILQTALELFDEHGTVAVSSIQEMDAGWYRDQYRAI